MSTEDKIKDEKAAQTPSSEMWYAIASIAFTFAAWCFAAFNAWAAIGLSAIAIALGVTGKKCPGRAMHNIAIGAIIAATVLLVVVAAFLIVVYLGLRS